LTNIYKKNSRIEKKHTIQKVSSMLIAVALLMSGSIFVVIPIQSVIAQDAASANMTGTGNATSANMTGTGNASMLNTERGGGPIANEIVVLFKEPEVDGVAAAFGDPITSVQRDVESEGEVELDLTSVAPELGAATFTVQLADDGGALGPTTAGEEQNITELVEEISDHPLVEAAEVNKPMFPHQSDSVNASTSAQGQTLPTGIERTDTEQILANIDDVNADIAILDTGINPHPDLNLLIGTERSFVRGATPVDNCGHGTHVAGTAAAKDNDMGVVGTAPGARLWNVKVLDWIEEGDPTRCGGDLAGIIQGLNYVAQNADVIDAANLSLGGYCPPNAPGCESPVYEAAISRLVDRGVVVIVSAGNNAEDAIDWVPARFQDPITVSAIADSDGKCGGTGPTLAGWGYNDDTQAGFSNYGSVVDMAAPGVNILSTWNDGEYNTISGTSMAAPYITGAAALYKSFNPDASPSDVRNALFDAASTPLIQCVGDGHGYFTGAADADGIEEPLLYVGNQLNNNATSTEAGNKTTSSGTTATTTTTTPASSPSGS
jgi:subtilisin family serine protease